MRVIPALCGCYARFILLLFLRYSAAAILLLSACYYPANLLLFSCYSPAILLIFSCYYGFIPAYSFMPFFMRCFIPHDTTLPLATVRTPCVVVRAQHVVEEWHSSATDNARYSRCVSRRDACDGRGR